MEYPPGFRNTANSCFASSVLQCLLNQSIFKDALGGVSTFPCKDCHKANGCAVAVAADLSREYVYGKESVLPSINVIKSLQSKVIAQHYVCIITVIFQV